jgi:hypothetical protein
MLLAGGSSAEASKRIVVDLTHQIAIAYQDGRVLFYGRVSTGKPGRRTPTGSFHVREKDIDHVSNLWPQPNGGAKMHYMLRITRDGIAMHLGPTPDYPASHGCIRMKDGFAQRMYAWAEKWTRVDIVGTPPVHSPPVALPAQARSERVLRRSRGGGAGDPLAIMSTNPKINNSSTSPAESKDVFSQPIRAARTQKRRSAPLDVFSSNPKTHRKSRKVKRSSRRINRKHHLHPLEAVSAR